MFKAKPLAVAVLLLASILLAALTASAATQFNDSARYLIGTSRATVSDGGFSDVYETSTGELVATYPNGATACYVAQSVNAGATWTQTSITGGTYCTMVQKSDSEFIAFNGATGIYRSTDKGASWALYATLVDTCVGSPSRHHSLEVNHADPTKLLLIWSGGSGGTDDLCASYSLDGGATWSATVIIFNTGGGGTSNTGLIHVSGSIWVAFFAQSSSCSYHRTTDNGATWDAGTQWTLCGTQNGVSKRGGYDGCACVFTTSDVSNPARINFLLSADSGVTFSATTVLSVALATDVAISTSAMPSVFDPDTDTLYAGIYYNGDGDPYPAAQQVYVYSYTGSSGQVVAQSYPTVIDNAAFNVNSTGALFAIGKQTSGTVNEYYYPAQTLLTPTTPAGLAAVVVSSGSVDLRWPVSSNDPDQVQGDFDYRIYVDSVSVGLDPTTAADGDGIRFSNLGVSATTLAFRVRAENTAQGTVSGFTCTVSVDASIVGDTDTCGSPGAAAIGSDLTFTTPTDTAAGLKGWCEDLMGDSAGSVFLCGLILVLVVFIAMAAALRVFVGPGPAPMAGGAIAGLGMAIFNVVATVWGVVWGIVLIALAAAVILAAVKALSILGALTSRESGGGEE